MPQLIRGYISYNQLNRLYSYFSPKRSTIYFDFKNLIFSIYQEQTAKLFMNTNIIYDFITEMSEFILHYYKYMMNNNIDVKLVFFYDVGDSAYHLKIDKEYKRNRKIRRFKTIGILEENDIMGNFYSCLDIARKMFNNLYNIYILELNFIESDFIPYYLISQNIMNSQFNLVVSADKDMLQCLNLERTALYDVHKKIFYGPKTWHMKMGLHKQELLPYFDMMLSIVGDTSDNVIGIKGIGWKTIEKLFTRLLELNCNISSLDNLDECIKNNMLYFDKSLRNKSLKIINNFDIVKKNYKLVSYKEIVRDLKREQKNELLDIINAKRLDFDSSIKEIEDVLDFVGNGKINI